jgi:hypothetical protein
MAGDNFNSAVQRFPVPDSGQDTASEERPMLDVALPDPPPISQLQDALIGQAVPHDGRQFVRVVHASGGQSDVMDDGV